MPKVIGAVVPPYLVLLFCSFFTNAFEAELSSFSYVGAPFIQIKELKDQSVANISAMAEDDQGFLWFANEQGIQRFDGESLISFPALAQFQSPDVGYIVAGSQGRLWIGASDALYQFDTKLNRLDKFIWVDRFLPSLKEQEANIELGGLELREGLLYAAVKDQILVIDEASVRLEQKISVPIAAQDSVIRMLVTNNNNIWLSSFHGNGALRYDGAQWQRFEHEADNKETLSAKLVVKIFEDSRGRIWFGTYSGVDLFLATENRFKRFTPRDLESDKYRHIGAIGNLVSDIDEDGEGNLWLSLYHGGVYLFNPEQEQFIHYQSVRDIDSTNISNAMTLHPSVIYIDRQDTLWALTQKGLGKLPKSHRKVQQWVNVSGKKCKPLHLTQDNDALLYACRNELYQMKNGQTEHLFTFEKVIYSISTANPDYIWIGSNGDGVFRYERATKAIKQYKLSSDDKLSVKANSLKSIHATADGEVFAITGASARGEGGSILVYDQANDKFIATETPYKYSSFIKIKEKLLLYRGYTKANKNLFWFDLATKQLRQVQVETGDIFAAINTGEELWMATKLLGVIKFNLATEVVTKVKLENVNEKQVNGLFFNEQSGVVYLTIKDQLYRLVANDSDGYLGQCVTCQLEVDLPSLNHLSSGQLYITDSYMMANGQIWITSTNRMIQLDSELRLQTSTGGHLSLTNYQVMGKDVTVDEEAENAYLTQSISYSSEIIIPPNTTLFSFDFAKLGSVFPDRVQYAYKLDGLNEDWIYTRAEKSEAIFSLLPSGDYHFLVKATDEAGNWQEQLLSLKVTVLPPWWLTWWAYLIYCLIVSTSLVVLFWLYYRKKMAEKEQQSIAAVADMKDQLFANLSHEFRTPLTLVMGPAQLINDTTTDEGIKHNAKLIKNNAKRLLHMVDQLLQLGQVKEWKQAELISEPLAPVIKSVIDAFSPLARDNQINLFLKGEVNKYWWIQSTAGALETIVSNLLTNAIKYTDKGGQVFVEITNEQGVIKLSVADSGCGIAERDQERIFDRFTRLETAQSLIPGTGIGLALVKQLVENIDGSLSVTSEVGKGTVFTVELQLAEEEELSDGYIEGQLIDYQSIFGSLEPTFKDDKAGSSIINNNEATLLIIDDNAEIRSFLRDNFSHSYKVIEANNGKVGLEQAIEQVPDLIISDVMMPEMDGFEMLEAIREHKVVCHIPVIMLTAKGDQQSRIKGMLSLADDYITKPFTVTELSARMDNLIGLRALMKQKFKEPESLVHYGVSEKDQRFVTNLNQLIEKQYQTTALTLSFVAQHMAMSERQFQRKIKALSGHTLSEYLREFRLDKALHLLQQGESVANTADKVGFNSSSYFVRCFKAKFGSTPNEFRQSD